MIRKIKNIVWRFLSLINLGGCVQLMLKSQLLEDGWFKSFNTKRSIDKNGKPIPWNTYPYIKFIGPRLNKNLEVFEFGSGNSTIWYAERVKNITSVENDKTWFEMISGRTPSNSEIIYRDLVPEGEYAKEVARKNKQYNIIIVDGRDRVNCIKNSIPFLTDDGVLVFDNSDLPIYKEGIDHLKESGFKKIDFIGMSPVTAHCNYTSVFYKTGNCLDI